MSTNDVPGHDPRNNDELALGAWAEHKDGSMIFVESTEAGRVIYSIFDMDKEPILEYRDAMPESSFKATFSWDSTGKKAGPNEKWTWHDKTPFPWDRIIKHGTKDGARLPSAGHIMTAAERVAESLALRGQELDKDNVDHRIDKTLSRVGSIIERLWTAVAKLPEVDTMPIRQTSKPLVAKTMTPRRKATVKKKAGAKR
jgi:hypothetical protein